MTPAQAAKIITKALEVLAGPQQLEMFKKD